MFFDPKIVLEADPKFLDRHFKLNMLPTMWQNFPEIGPQTSEISRRKYKETAVKHKAFPNYRSGRPNNCYLT